MAKAASDCVSARSSSTTRKVSSRSSRVKPWRPASARPSSDHAPAKCSARSRSWASTKRTMPLHRTQSVSKTMVGGAAILGVSGGAGSMPEMRARHRRRNGLTVKPGGGRASTLSPKTDIMGGC